MEQKRPADIFQELLDYLWNGLGLEEKGWKRLKKGDFKKKMKNGLTYLIWFERSRYNYIDYEIGHGNVEAGVMQEYNLQRMLDGVDKDTSYMYNLMQNLQYSLATAVGLFKSVISLVLITVGSGHGRGCDCSLVEYEHELRTLVYDGVDFDVPFQ